MIIEGLFIQHDRSLRQQVLINPQTIEAFGNHLGKSDLVFPDHILIFPGFIDTHVHAREDKTARENYKEDFVTATQAALNGGVVAFMDMPNNPCPPMCDEEYLFKRKLILSKTKMDIVPYAAIGANSQPLKARVPYKVYLGPSFGPFLFSAEQELDKVLSRYRGLAVSFHCEDAGILNQFQSKTFHHERRPVSSEIKAVKLALYFTKKYDLQTTLCHLSTQEALEFALEEKAKGLNISIELSPHHLYFSRDDETLELQVNPPFRSKEDREFLLKMLSEGRIDYLATDHAPHSLEEKKKGTSGLTHLDTYGAFVSWLILEKKVSPQIIAHVCSYRPGKFLNSFQEKKYGEIKSGFEALFTLIDLSKKTLISKSFLQTKNKISPFLGIEFPGSAQVLHHPQRSFTYGTH